MATEIWKFILRPNSRVEMPIGAKVLTAHEQRDEICLWAEVDPSAKKETRNFEVFGTGHAMPEGKRRYIGTVHMSGGAFVFHVFEAA